MLALLRSLLIGFGATVTAVLFPMPDPAYAERLRRAVIQLSEVYAKANEALLRGDVRTWSDLAPMTKDFVLMSPFGGEPSRFADYPPERIARMGKFFRNGQFKQEVLQAYSADDLIVLVTIERANVEVGGLPGQDWALRVTSVFRLEAGRWHLAHRHADPLVRDLSLAETARLARGERETHAN